VLRRRNDTPIDFLVSAGLDTLAVRVPAHEAACALLAAAGVPVAAPSANRSGAVSPTTAAHVLADLGGRIDAVLDSGAAHVGLESTVLDLTAEPTLLRLGGVAIGALEAVIGTVQRGGPPAPGGAMRSPGLLASHYAPQLPLRLSATAAGPDEALLAFGPAPPGAGATWNLSERGDLTEAASRLFAGLRILDAEGRRLALTRIAAMKVPHEGLGDAINDRLARAAAPGR
jgi:L-threonylcarbamoyladenylate synthase